jgi:hypothetical protein
MEAATAYLRMNTVYVHSLSETVSGLWILSKPVFAVPVEETLVLDEKILICLKSSTSGLPDPKNIQFVCKGIEMCTANFK